MQNFPVFPGDPIEYPLRSVMVKGEQVTCNTDITIPKDGSYVIYNLSDMGIPEIDYLAAQHLTATAPAQPHHTHLDRMEICYLVKGERHFTVDNQEYTVRGNDVFVTYPNEMHGSGGVPHGRGLMFWMHILLPKNADGFLGVQSTSTTLLVESLHDLPSRHFRGSARLESLFREILRICSGNPKMTDLRLRVLLLEWLIEVTDRSITARSTAPTQDIKKVMSWVEKEILRNPPIEELAEVAHLSSSRLNSKFREQIGMAPGEFVKQTRMNLSKSLLRKGDRNITQIAFDLGYCSSQHFSDTFKRYFGYCPKQFLKSVNVGKCQEPVRMPDKKLHPWIEKGYVHGYTVEPVKK